MCVTCVPVCSVCVCVCVCVCDTPSIAFRHLPPNSSYATDGDVGLHVLGCRVDILGTNCKKLLKVKMSGGGGGGGGSRFGFSTCNHVRGGGSKAPTVG